MSVNNQIRRLNGEDLDQFYAMRLESLTTDRSAFFATLEEEKSKGPARFLETLTARPSKKIAIGAFVEENLAGIATLMKGERTKDQHAVNLFGMFVSAAYRGRGVGGDILDFALKHAADEMKAKMMFLSVEANNQGALRLYESRGFKAWGTQPNSAIDHGVFYDEIHMAKEIS